jgi:FkbM family methyltransferase
VRGLSIRINVTTEMEEFRVRTYATKEPETLGWLDARLLSGDVFMDVGANVGLYSLYAATRQPGCRVFAFEPESQNFAGLCRNIVLNPVSNVTPSNIALGAREAFDLLYVGDFQAGAALHALGEGERSFDAVLKQGVLALPLDALISRYGVPSPQLIKIDVDGTEEAILAGASAALASSKCRSVLVELNYGEEADVATLVQRMAATGLALSGRSEWVTSNDGVNSRNFIFDRAPGTSG